MIDRILCIVVPIIVKCKYLVLSLKIKFLNRANPVKNKSEIEKLYESYIFKVVKGEIFPQSNSNIESLFQESRILKSRTLKSGEEEFLIKLLEGNMSKWFVPHVLYYIDRFSRKMMVNLIETAIHVKDPSYNSNFLYPATKVFDLEVNDYLVKQFPNSSIEYKAGILRSFYWVKSRAIECSYSNGMTENYVPIYSWKEDTYRETSKMSVVEYQNYIVKVEQKYNERNALLLNEFFKIENKKLRKSISWYLPKEINQYEEEYRPLAEQYLSKK